MNLTLDARILGSDFGVDPQEFDQEPVLYLIASVCLSVFVCLELYIGFALPNKGELIAI